jgi:hypothetical protein
LLIGLNLGGLGFAGVTRHGGKNMGRALVRRPGRNEQGRHLLFGNPIPGDKECAEIALEASVDAAKTPFGLSLSKGERGFCGVTSPNRGIKNKEYAQTIADYFMSKYLTQLPSNTWP